MKTTLSIAAAALLLAACAGNSVGNTVDTSAGHERGAGAREERYTPLGTYLPRKKGQTANNAGTVSDVERENMKNTGPGTGAVTQH